MKMAPCCKALQLLSGARGISVVIEYELSRHDVKNLIIADIKEEKALEKDDILNNNTPMLTISTNLKPGNLAKAACEADIFIQATPLGMAGYEL